jgi:hypothetical protein
MAENGGCRSDSEDDHGYGVRIVLHARIEEARRQAKHSCDAEQLAKEDFDPFAHIGPSQIWV